MTAVRIGLVSGEFDPERDGVSDYTARLAAHLREQGAEALVLTTHERAGAGGGAIGLATAWDLREVRGATRTLRRMRLDVVHVQFAPSSYGYRGAIGALPLLLAGGPRLAVTLHDYGRWSWRPRWLPAPVAPSLWRGAERRGLWDRETLLLTSRADRLVVTSPSHAEVLRGRLPSRADRVVEIPTGPGIEPVDLDRAAARARLGVGSRVPVLVFSGYVHPISGIPYLLDAAVRLRSSFPDLRLFVIGGFEDPGTGPGSSPYRHEVQALIDGRALSQTVHITGWQPERRVSTLLRAADVAVFPFTAGVTARIGSVLAALEHRVPTVATAASPPDPALEDGRHLLLVPRRDSGALAAAVTRLLTDKELGLRLAEAGAELAAHHSWPSIAAAHLGLYHGMLAARASVRSNAELGRADLT
jgi:glycosyltransferase involved in cell wall biosynthesis